MKKIILLLIYGAVGAGLGLVLGAVTSRTRG